MRKFGVPGLVVLVAVGGTLLGRLHEPGIPTSTEPLKPAQMQPGLEAQARSRAGRGELQVLAQLEALDGRVDEIRLALSHLEARLDERAAQPEEELIPVSEPSPEELKAQRDDRRYWLERQLHAEPRDSEWTHLITEQLERLAEEGALGGSEILEIDCGNTLCRIRAEHLDAEARDRFEEAVLTAREIEGASVAPGDPNGEGLLSSDAYFVRRGQPADHPALR